MKGLRTWIGLFFVIVLGFALAACDGNPKQHRASAEAVAKAETEQQKQREEARKRTETEEKQKQERARTERRVELVKSIRAAFDPTKADAPAGDQPAWVGELRRGSPQPAGEACEKLEKFREIDWALGVMVEQREREEESRISWLEIGWEEIQARKLHRETGLAVAKSFLAIFGLPRETRQKMECGRGEGVFELDDGLRLVAEVSRILQAIKAEPKAIGSSPAMLRQVLLKDLREQIAHLRGEIKAGRMKESDGGANAIRYVAQEATREWSFTPKELGLTTEEVAMLHQKKE